MAQATAPILDFTEGATALHRGRVRLLRCCGSVCAWSWIAAHHPQRTYRAIARAHEAYTFFATTRRTVSL